MNFLNQHYRVNPKDIDNYLKGKLTPQQMHQIEMEALSDPFLSDALEGFQQFPNEISTVPKFSKRKTWVWIYSAIALVILVVGFIMFDLNTKSSNGLAITQKNVTVKNHVFNSSKKVTQNNSNLIALNQPLKNSTIANTSSQKNIKTIPFVREIVNLEVYQAKPEVYGQEKHYDLAKAKIKTIAYHNFIAVDYSVIYIDKKTFEDIDIGTPADQPNMVSYTVNQENKLTKTKTYTYKEYLEKSLTLLSKQRYKVAYEHFQVIKDHYPQDVNALFYSGFSQFNLTHYEQAISYFDLAMQNSFDFFYEDAQWYKALCLQELGKYTEAKKLFREIIEKGGFYAKQAYNRY